MRVASVAVVAAIIAAMAAPAPAPACDVCSIYTATELREEQTGVRLGIAEQFSDFSTLRQGGEVASNPYDEYLYSSITQLVFGYQFTRSLGAQILLPIIARPFRRITANGIQTGDASGVGDMSIAGNWLAYDHVSEESVILLTLLGAIKLPTGNPDFLKEETEEDEEDSAPPSGIHGHDLALGSGSTDIILGGQLFASWQRLYGRSFLQYAIRREGAFDYQFANELVWNAGLGAYLWLEHPYTLGVQVNYLVETKGEDTVNGIPTHDTAITAIYVGPGFVFTWGSALGAELIFDFPTLQNNTGLQAVPTFRVRGGLTWRF